jgi:dihydroorotate dehydrogenase
MYSLVRPLLFALPAETVHELALTLLRAGAGALCPPVPDAPVELMGLRFANPIGLAAGLDKDGDCVDGLARLGFGFIEVGTVTPRPQPGNPRPRMFRLPRAQALVNRMGFNNKGVDHLVQSVADSNFDGVLGVNIGKNRDTPMEQAVDDYVHGLERVHAVASYVVVNISSPNTPGLRGLQHGLALDALLAELRRRQSRLDKAAGRRVPLLIKIAPDNEPDELAAMARAFVEHGMDGVIVGNTTVSRAGVDELKHADEQGGLSGAPLRPRADDALATMASELDGRLPLIGVGGINSAADADRKRRLGADLVQLYTGLIYQGPGLVRTSVNGWSRTATS